MPPRAFPPRAFPEHCAAALPCCTSPTSLPLRPTLLCVLPCRLLPEMTPGRAFLWGSVLAVWGVGALVATTARGLDINNKGEAPR